METFIESYRNQTFTNIWQTLNQKLILFPNSERPLIFLHKTKFLSISIGKFVRKSYTKFSYTETFRVLFLYRYLKNDKSKFIFHNIF